MATKRAKHRFLEGLGIIIIALALVRCAYEANWDKLTEKKSAKVIESPTPQDSLSPQDSLTPQESPTPQDSLLPQEEPAPQEPSTPQDSSSPQEIPTPSQPSQPFPTRSPIRYVPDGGKYHPILSVSSFRECFPDSNDVQLAAAQHWGVTPVRDRADAELRKDELVYMAASPYYAVAPLTSSIPYLVPRAAVLLHDIGQAFFDSLQVKGLPLHHFIVSSVLRSEEDVRRLRRVNKNATEQSCHLYGTTFDINYNRYQSVAYPNRELVGSDRLKWVLSEVLEDMRQQGRCYIKYEVRQPCFHITVR